MLQSHAGHFSQFSEGAPNYTEADGDASGSEREAVAFDHLTRTDRIPLRVARVPAQEPSYRRQVPVRVCAGRREYVW